MYYMYVYIIFSLKLRFVESDKDRPFSPTTLSDSDVETLWLKVLQKFTTAAYTSELMHTDSNKCPPSITPVRVWVLMCIKQFVMELAVKGRLSSLPYTPQLQTLNHKHFQHKLKQNGANNHGD